VLGEVEHLVRYGFLEVELLGQTVNHWREPGGDLDFADLLDAVAAVPGLRRLRFVTSYPRDFTPRMVERVGQHDVICPYLHLPVQSGSDRILRLMGRGYAIGEYLDLVDALRDARAGLAISTDLIVGFPGETDEDFAATLSLVERVRFAQVFAFNYSPRPGTAAPRLPFEPAPAELASRRLQELFELQRSIQRELNEGLVGQRLEVLVTGWGKTSSQQVGRTSCHRVVHFDTGGTAVPAGQIVPVRIEAAFDHSLRGARVDLAAPPPVLAPRGLRVLSG
jgi:tRNA-2-methylthio-N6-dimethylallyladenosine synthase